MTLLGRLELRDFPRPEVARCLSPNGRSHWKAKWNTCATLQRQVWAEAKVQQLPEMHGGVVTVRPTFTYPVQRRRDIDNACTGVLKASLDALVRGGWLLDDSSEHVRLEPPVIRVTKGVRMLVLEFETSDVAPERLLSGAVASSQELIEVAQADSVTGTVAQR